MKYGVMEGFQMHHSQKKYGVWPMNSRLELFKMAKELGFHGIELGIGLDYKDDSLWTGKGTLRHSIKSEVARTSVGVASICLHLLNYIENSPASTIPEHRMVAHGIICNALDAASELNASIILVPFYGTARLKSEEQKENLIKEMRELVTRSEDAGVCLALETSLEAEEAVDIIETIDSDFVQVYFDMGNAISMGYDLIQEIETLGQYIAQVHVKDNPNGTLGDGKIDFNQAIKALKVIGFDEYLVLETPSLTDSTQAASYNLRYLKRVVEGD